MSSIQAKLDPGLQYFLVCSDECGTTVHLDNFPIECLIEEANTNNNWQSTGRRYKRKKERGGRTLLATLSLWKGPETQSNGFLEYDCEEVINCVLHYDVVYALYSPNETTLVEVWLASFIWC